MADLVGCSVTIVSQARLSHREGRESGQVPIRLLYCILSSRVPNDVGVNIIGTCSEKAKLLLNVARSPNNMPKKVIAPPFTTKSINMPRISWCVRNEMMIEFDQTLSSRRESLARETTLTRT